MPPASRKPPIEHRELIVTMDTTTKDLAAGALRGEADRRRRAGVKISGELDADRRAGVDVRSGALRVVEILAEADGLEVAATAIEAAWDEATPLPEPPAPAPADTPPGDPPDPDAQVDADVAAARVELGLTDPD